MSAEEKTLENMNQEELQVYQAERLQTIAVQNDRILDQLKSIRGRVDFFFILVVVALALQFLAWLF